jgi:hypothetical protein
MNNAETGESRVKRFADQQMEVTAGRLLQVGVLLGSVAVLIRSSESVHVNLIDRLKIVRFMQVSAFLFSAVFSLLTMLEIT